MQPNTRPKFWMSGSRHKLGDHERRVWNRILPAWRQPFTEGVTRRCSSSADLCPADVATPPPGILLSAHPPAQITSNKAGGYHNLFTHFLKDPKCKVCRRTKVTRAPCRRTYDDRADRIKIAERFGDMTEEHESGMHHKYALFVQDLVTQWIQSETCKTTSALETQGSLRFIVHPEGIQDQHNRGNHGVASSREHPRLSRRTEPMGSPSFSEQYALWEHVLCRTTNTCSAAVPWIIWTLRSCLCLTPGTPTSRWRLCLRVGTVV